MLIKIPDTFSRESLITLCRKYPATALGEQTNGKTDRFSEHLLNGAMAPTQLFPTSFHTVIMLMSSMDSLLNTSSTPSNKRRVESKFNCLDCFQTTFFFFYKSEFTHLSFLFFFFLNCVCSNWYCLAFCNLSQLCITLLHVLIFILAIIKSLTLLKISISLLS